MIDRVNRKMKSTAKKMAYNILICSYMREEGRIDINIVVYVVYFYIVFVHIVGYLAIFTLTSM